jgi:hypothetical protein
MTHRTFEYDDNLLIECASSSLAAPEQHEYKYLDRSCRVLFEQHSKHYRRQHDAASSQLDVRLENFIRSVVFVHQHNSRATSGWASHRHHEVALNQFSDMDLTAPFTPASHASPDDASSIPWQLRQVRDHPPTRPLQNSNDNLFVSDRVRTPSTTFLDSSESILRIAADLAIGKGSFNKMNPKKEHTSHHSNQHITTQEFSTHVINLPMDHPFAFQSPDVQHSPEYDGALISIKENPSYHHHHKTQPWSPNLVDPDASTSAIGDNDDISFEEANPMDDFSTFLNWATADNPDGVPIVNDSFDQVCMV